MMVLLPACRRRPFTILAALLGSVLALTPPAAAAAPAIDFNRQVLPILSEHCFACHGPDEAKRKAKLRLDTRDGLFGKLRHGGHVVVPSKPAQSALVERITATEPTEIMPPPKHGKPLTAGQIDTLRHWVEQGAPWAQHWAFVAPRRPALPRVADAAWPRNPIDRFLLTRLEAEGLRPNAEADRVRLLRRVTLDLTGLPPTLAEVDAFLADTRPGAYERVVDRLLDSPRYGEHMARFWLDAARYGDTHGLHLDNYREMWPYRQWVIRAFNRNLPFDQFIIRQLAGDLLPGATLADQVASGFNRCHVTTSEGGSIAEECYVRNVVDRVDTTGVVFLGLTFGCARCHDHKFDPISQKNYYSLFAFFNSLDESPLDGNSAQYAPIARVATPAQLQALAELQKKADTVRQAIAAEVAKVKYEEPAGTPPARPAQRTEVVWIDDDLPAGAKPSTDGGVNGSWKWATGPAPIPGGARVATRTAAGLGQHFFEGASPGLRVGRGDVLFAHVYLDPANPPQEIMLQWNTGQWRHRAYWGKNVIPWGADGTGERRAQGPLPPAGKWVRLEVEAGKVGLQPGMVITGWAFTQHDGTVFWDRAGLVTQTPQGTGAHKSLTAWLQAQKAAGGAGLPKPIQQIVKRPAKRRSQEDQKQLRDYFIANVWPHTRSTFAPLQKQLKEIEQQRTKLEKATATTLVSRELPTPRPAHVLKRGEYDQKGEKVERGTPAFLPPLPADLPRNRLGFARWLVRPDQPLTARVAVNRFWQQLFGTGLVKTAEDFGAQGEPPSHPELLDWLAVQFVEDGWDVKKTMRRLVTSAAYRQSARATPEKLAKDPANRLLSRGPRFRLDAEMLRDQALALSGLLVEHLGGPSVKPPQPAGLWEAVGYTGSNTVHFVADAGAEKIHRRSLYTFWKRTAPPPQMTAFDAPSREACVVRRERTNTPLQALLLLNEQQYVACARALAGRAVQEGGATSEECLAYMFRLATARRPDADELVELMNAYLDHRARYARDPEAAKKLIAGSATKPGAAVGELAAYTMIANLILNLDEVLTKG